ncbi:glycosyltransferase family 2 protein [Fulvimonas soli]|jgi:glycosyltransferase involved in cell wall biosynthesis|uniref:Glycosyltransferase involved in cell wall biosynthesis n=1 Tax=Fulvimonas soli TaxID=155197 RepID=A0A316I6U8_9GAMM|nr:glycosyltransferase family 2 protein [Fulvimonas soli]PWK88485.1 glycosyltransferase involved in cell wall biosynthesis [Fulvimonas soli]TNY26898.1 glycosyl transferase family 2 [Fulvimonas soli]
MAQLTVVVPAYNEAAVLEDFHARLAAVLDGLGLDCAVLYVDDGSGDATWAVIGSLLARDARAGALRLSRNFGKEAALTAGLDHVREGAAVVIDADLQDPPELIPELVAQWRAGYDVVYATRSARAGEGVFKRLTAAAFYRAMEKLSDTAVPRDTGDFRLLSRRALDALAQLRERQRFMKGLFAWIGYRQTAVRYLREPRQAGRSKWNYWRLTQLAIEGITSFSTAPLRLATWVGLGSSLLAFLYGLWVLGKALLYGDPVRGYPTLMLVILFLGGVQLLALGVIGEYLGRNYAESKRRPLYFVEEARLPR